jgi:hypothetical protein
VTDDDVRKVTDEAARLLEALSGLSALHNGWDHQGHPTGEAPDGPDDGQAPGGYGSFTPYRPNGSAETSAECRVCPICRLIAMIRQLRPEVLTHLTAAGEELLAAAREFAASGTGAPAGGRPGPAGPTSGSTTSGSTTSGSTTPEPAGAQDADEPVPGPSHPAAGPAGRIERIEITD